MANHNLVVLMGNLTRDPELKYLQSGVPVVNFGLATNKKFTDRETGEQKEKACFVDCEAWNKTAEVIAQYTKQGSPIFIQGELQYDSWETDEGKRSKLKVRVDRMQLIGSKNGDSNGGGGATAKPAQAQASQSSNDDDLPF